MANEISFSVSLQCNNGSFQDSVVKQGNIDQSNIGAAGGVAVILTTETQLDFGDVSTNGYLYLCNTDADNSVSFGKYQGVSESMATVGKLKPAEFALFRVEPGVTIAAIASVASVKVQYLLLAD